MSFGFDMCIVNSDNYNINPNIGNYDNEGDIDNNCENNYCHSINDINNNITEVVIMRMLTAVSLTSAKQ